MRTGWAGLVFGLVAGCSLNAPVDADFNADVDVNPPPSGADAGVKPDRGSDGPRQAVADDGDGTDAAVEAGAGVADAGPPALFDTHCDTSEVCEAMAPDGTDGRCWIDHTDPERFGHDMAWYCTFDCGHVVTIPSESGTVMEWQTKPEREQACWTIGGTCERLGDAPDTYCVPGN